MQGDGSNNAEDDGILVWKDGNNWYISAVKVDNGWVVSHYFKIGRRYRGFSSMGSAVATLWRLMKKRRYEPYENLTLDWDE